MKCYHNNKKIYNSHKTKCCICGETEKCCLEFHHIGTKHFNISKSLKYITEEQLLDELKQVICVCKNCHSKLHNKIIQYDRNS